MKKLKIMTFFGTRPEIIKLAEVMRRLDECTNHIMVHTGQSYSYNMSKIFFENLGVREPDHFLEVKSSSVGEQIAKVIQRGEEVLKKEKPDALLILGDTNSALVAIVARRLKIPIFHMEAGNRCFSDATPEEINRRIVDHLSDVNLVYSENARFNLLREGIHPKHTFVTGSPLREVLFKNKEQIEGSDVLERLELEKKKYFVVSFHREENVETKNLNKFLETLEAVADKYKFPLIVTAHPRTKKKLEEMKYEHPLIQIHDPFGYFDYVKLQLEAYCIMSDSGTLPEDSAMLKLPAIQLRETNERPEAYDEGVNVMTGFDKDVVLESIEVVQNTNFSIPNAYQPLNVSEKVVRHILGLTRLL